MAAITVQAPPARTGIDLTSVAVAATGGGDYFVIVNGSEYLVVINGDASPHTVSITFQSGEDGVTPAAKQVVVPASHTMIIGPFPAYYQDGNSQVHWTYDAVTSVKVAVFRTS